MALNWAEEIVDGNRITHEAIEEIRNNINIEKARRNQEAVSWANPVGHNIKITAAVINEIYSAIGAIKACSIPSPAVVINTETLTTYKDMLNTFSAEVLTRWVFSDWQFIKDPYGIGTGINDKFFIFYQEGLILGWLYSWQENGVAAQFSFDDMNLDGTFEGYNFKYQQSIS